MTRYIWGPLALAALVLAFAPVHPWGVPATAQQAPPVRILLETTDEGYLCVEGCDAVDYSEGAWTPGIDVPMGSVVELGFRWAHAAYTNEEHIMLIEGYRLESDLIDAENREAWIRFVADQPGTFTVKCDFHCDLHDYMQRARLRVTRGGEGTASTGPTYTPTTLELTSHSRVITGFEPVIMHAALTDDEGEPLPRAEVRFFTEAEFGGVRELVHIGTSQTDTDGIAHQHFRPLSAEPEQRVIARFAGAGLYDESEHEISLQLTGAPPPAYVPPGTGFENIRSIAGLGVVAVFGALWLTFAFVLLQALRVSRVGRHATRK